MSRKLSVLASAALATAVLAAASPAHAETLEPTLPPIASQLVCPTCPPDLVASVEVRYELGFIPYSVVVIRNAGGPATQASTVSVRYRVGWYVYETLVPVQPFAAGETRVVYWVSVYTRYVVGACADALGDVPESNEANNCT